MTVPFAPTNTDPPSSLAVRYESDPIGVTRSVLFGDQAITGAVRRRVTDGSGDEFADWWGSFIRGTRRDPDRLAPDFRFIDLFSSVGGLSVGAMEAISSVGRRPLPLMAADVDARALQVYRANIRPREAVAESVRGMLDFRISGSGEEARFAYEPIVTDRRLRVHEGGVDLILAGPPCQGHSSLNNHSRHEDPKNLLYLTVPAAAVALGARHIVIENVPNVVADRRGVVQTTITLLRNAGYHLSHGVLAADKIGWPQTRKRFFLIASRDSIPLNLSVLGAGMGRAALPITWLFDDLEGGALNDADIMNSVPHLSKENEARVNWLFDNDEHNLPNEIRPDCHKNGTTYTATYGRMFGDQPAPTITGGFLTPGRGRFIHPHERRVLTPREAARVQGFPDWFDFCPNPSLPPSRSDVARWVGNAVPSILGYVATLAAVHAEVTSLADLKPKEVVSRAA